MMKHWKLIKMSRWRQQLQQQQQQNNNTVGKPQWCNSRRWPSFVDFHCSQSGSPTMHWIADLWICPFTLRVAPSPCACAWNGGLWSNWSLSTVFLIVCAKYTCDGSHSEFHYKNCANVQDNWGSLSAKSPKSWQIQSWVFLWCCRQERAETGICVNAQHQITCLYIPWQPISLRFVFSRGPEFLILITVTVTFFLFSGMWFFSLPYLSVTCWWKWIWCANFDIIIAATIAIFILGILIVLPFLFWLPQNISGI